MTATFDKVADIIAETSEIDRETITPESHTIDDLGIDSLDFLDIVFAIDKEFGIKIPLEKWTQDVNEGKVATEEYFVLKNLCAKIDELRAAKAWRRDRPAALSGSVPDDPGAQDTWPAVFGRPFDFRTPPGTTIRCCLNISR